VKPRVIVKKPVYLGFRHAVPGILHAEHERAAVPGRLAALEPDGQRYAAGIRIFVRVRYQVIQYLLDMHLVAH
jgi:hypothetical protein